MLLKPASHTLTKNEDGTVLHSWNVENQGGADGVASLEAWRSDGSGFLGWSGLVPIAAGATVPLGFTLELNNTAQGPLPPGDYDIDLFVVDQADFSNLASHTYSVTVAAAAVPPVANFVPSPNGGEAPLSVQFIDQSTGDITSWFWDFGDGGTSTAQSPVYVYNNPGTYNISLTVTGPGGSDTAQYLGLTVFAPTPLPVANFTFSPSGGDVPLAVQFTDLSTDADGWSWDFGDGNFSNQQHPSHTYLVAGIYTIALSVFNSAGSDEVSASIIVTEAGPPPVGSVTFSPEPVGLYNRITFTGTGWGASTEYTFFVVDPTFTFSQTYTIFTDSQGGWSLGVIPGDIADQPGEWLARFFLGLDLLWDVFFTVEPLPDAGPTVVLSEPAPISAWGGVYNLRGWGFAPGTVVSVSAATPGCCSSLNAFANANGEIALTLTAGAPGTYSFNFFDTTRKNPRLVYTLTFPVV